MRSEMQRRSFAAQFRAEELDGKRYIEGYFAVFGDIYDMGGGITESIAPGAFDGQLGEDIRCLIDHETRLVLGRTKAGTLELRVDDHGLWFRVEINPLDVDATNLYARVQRGDVSQCSFGFRILDEEYRLDEATGNVHFTIKKVQLYEGSIVTFPAYGGTEAGARSKQAEEIRKRQFEAWKARQKGRLKR
jgi:HK97 family phage prohead protease